MAMLKQVRLPDHVANLPNCHPDHARALLAIDQHARDRGVRLYPQTNFRLLSAIFSTHAESGARLAPLYDPQHHPLTPETAFWIAGLDDDGQVVLTAAARVFDLQATSLRDEA